MQHEQQCWPDGTPKSCSNAFTLGYRGIPHGYIPGQPASSAPAKPRAHVKGGFGANNGTISGGLSKRIAA